MIDKAEQKRLRRQQRNNGGGKNERHIAVRLG